MTTIETNEIFDLAFRFVTETQENVFLTGKAGTGKTTFLKYLKERCAKNMVVAAPTGVAAINAGGVTIHSLFQLPLHPFLPTDKNRKQLLEGIRYNKQRINLLRKIELLVIDEISMVRCDTLDAIDGILRSVRRNRAAAFGGVQLLFIGDLFQLPPVAKPAEWQLLHEHYASPFFFDSKAVKEQVPLLLELTTIYRQKERGFVRLLNKVRDNQMDIDDYEMLNERYLPGFVPYYDEKYITLTSHNLQADNINQAKLQLLPASSFTYKARVEGDFPENSYPAEAEMVLKEGTQVMFIKNDNAGKQYFNGKLGVVHLLESDKIIVDCDGEKIEVRQEVWENIRYSLNRVDEKLEQKVLGRFFQYPLRLAWAITIHKSQGLTFDKVMIDAAAAFSSGQVYVALSRCTSLEGVVLLSKIPPTAIYSNEVVVSAYSSLVPRGSLQDRFMGARLVFTIQLLSEIFLMEDLDRLVNWLHNAVEKCSSKLNAAAMEWIVELRNSVRKEAAIGAKFLTYVPALLQQQAAIEDNNALQQRVQDAAGYFGPIFQHLQQLLQQHPLLAQTKEVAAYVDEILVELLTAFHRTNHYLRYCQQPFTVAGYLSHKLDMAVPRIQITCDATRKKKMDEQDVKNPALLDALKAWREDVAAEQKIPVYAVATNNSLTEIATYLPTSVEQLLLVNGIGKSKADKFGAGIIRMVTDYCNEHNIESIPRQEETQPKAPRKKAGKKATPANSSADISLHQFKQGKSIPDISKERDLQVSTVEGHLMGFVASGLVPVSTFADETAVEKISAIIHSNPGKRLGELNELLNKTYSFIQIKAVQNHLLWQQDQIATAASSK